MTNEEEILLVPNQGEDPFEAIRSYLGEVEEYWIKNFFNTLEVGAIEISIKDELYLTTGKDDDECNITIDPIFVEFLKGDELMKSNGLTENNPWVRQRYFFILRFLVSERSSLIHFESSYNFIEDNPLEKEIEDPRLQKLSNKLYKSIRKHEAFRTYLKSALGVLKLGIIPPGHPGTIECHRSIGEVSFGSEKYSKEEFARVLLITYNCYLFRKDNDEM